ncbi:MAG: DNA repair protein NreA [Natronomonas sp.]
MNLEEYLDRTEPAESVELRRLAEQKSYAVTEYIEEAKSGFETALSDETLVGSTAPSVFVGRSSYPQVSAGVLAPVGNEAAADSFTISGEWYADGLSIDDVFRRRTGLLNSTRQARVGVEDVWDGFVGVQREVAIADRPVDIELGLSERPEFDVDVGELAAPRGPRATTEQATLTENPHVPRAIEKTLSDDDWRAEGAITYLYRRGFDVYEIRDVLSAGALGEADSRRLVPTRWSITAVDDTVGKYLRGQIHNAPSVDTVSVHHESYMGNDYWVVLAPGDWEFELVELKAPGSIWNPDPDGELYIAADHEGKTGRDSYVDETSGAYYATRLGVLEELAARNRQAKVFVLRHATSGYWAPVGVWQIRESIRAAFDGRPATAETFHGAIRRLTAELPVSETRLRRAATMVAGVQTGLSAFSGE